jgi:hypothetical protein
MLCSIYIYHLEVSLVDVEVETTFYNSSLWPASEMGNYMHLHGIYIQQSDETVNQPAFRE